MLLKLLTKPYPIKNPGIKSWKTILIFGLFIAIFLLVFQPFGISEIKGNYKTIIVLGYGLVTMIMLSLNVIIEVIFRNIFDEKNWVVYKQILWSLWIIFTIGLGNVFYTHWMFSYPELNLNNIIFFQLITVSVAFLPLSSFVLFTQNRYLRDNVNGAVKAESIIKNKTYIAKKAGNSGEVVLFSENNKKSIGLNPEKIRFIESLGNYIKIYYWNEDKITTPVLRSSLKKVLFNLKEHLHIIQCHRAYIVNTKHIINITGNAQGYRLKMADTQNEVPVSRSFIKEFNDFIRQNRV